MKYTIKDRLEQIMSDRNLKQVDILHMTQPLQEQLGINLGKSTLSQYINGIQSADRKRIHLLSKALNVSEPWLMGYDVPSERKNNNIMTVYNELSEENKRTVYDFAVFQLNNQKFNQNKNSTLNEEG